MFYLLLVRLWLFLFPPGPVTLIKGDQLIERDLPILVRKVASDVGEVDEGPDRWLVVVVRRPERV